MAPNAQQGTTTSEVGGICTDYQKKKQELTNPALELSKIEKSIPKEAFIKSPFWSLFYMFFDYSMWLGATFLIWTFRHSPEYNTYPVWVQYAATAAFWNVAGFFMWCIFVVGHDCGHGTFSNNQLFNDIIGHITHGSIMVPFYPWALSHRRHHMHHNHVDKDYSHPWYTPDKLDPSSGPDFELARQMESYTWMRFLFPFIGWAVYLFGLPDGSHFIPLPIMGDMNNRMWKESALNAEKDSERHEDHKRCLISTSVVLAYAYGMMQYAFNWDWSLFAYYYLAPALVYGWWLVTVTYLQHHDHSTLVFDNENWKFVYSAFETIDRKFGFGIDTLHHHISDGHVVHHLFYKKIPHYNLPMATEALYAYMAKNNLGHLVKTDDTSDFMIRVHKYFVQFGFSARRFSPENYTPEAIKERLAKDASTKLDLANEVARKQQLSVKATSSAVDSEVDSNGSSSPTSDSQPGSNSKRRTSSKSRSSSKGKSGKR
jgi:omega-3 fatty acid desaturase (delta-15 desaturase)